MALDGGLLNLKKIVDSWKLKYSDLDLDPKGWIRSGSGSVWKKPHLNITNTCIGHNCYDTVHNEVESTVQTCWMSSTDTVIVGGMHYYLFWKLFYIRRSQTWICQSVSFCSSTVMLNIKFLCNCKFSPCHSSGKPSRLFLTLQINNHEFVV